MENSHSNLIFKFDMHLFSDFYLEALLKGLTFQATLIAVSCWLS